MRRDRRGRLWARDGRAMQRPCWLRSGVEALRIGVDMATPEQAAALAEALARIRADVVEAALERMLKAVAAAVERRLGERYAAEEARDPLDSE